METELNKVNPEQEADKPKKCACRHKHGMHVAVILVVLIVGAICWHVHPRPTGLKPGMYCAVELRRDAANGSAPISIRGELIAIYRDAILLEVADHSFIINDKPKQMQMWIPKNNILLVKYDEWLAEINRHCIIKMVTIIPIFPHAKRWW